MNDTEIVTIDGSNNTMDILAIANRAEETMEAHKTIIAVALGVTTANDWVDMKGKPYLEVSGSEKIAGLFGISWTFLNPDCETDQDGHYTYTYTGIFKLSGRSITVEGSRSSRDSFFTQYDYTKDYVTVNDKKVYPAKTITERDNKRDVRMAAMTNLIGNGITRILGLRGLTYEILEKHADIREVDIASVKFDGKSKKDAYKKGTVEPANSSNKAELLTDGQNKAIFAISKAIWKPGAILNEINSILASLKEKPIKALADLTKSAAILIIGKMKEQQTAQEAQNK